MASNCSFPTPERIRDGGMCAFASLRDRIGGGERVDVFACANMAHSQSPAEAGWTSSVTRFGWFDSPPSLNRLLGVQWLVRILHPRLSSEPLGPRVAEFRARYYHRSPTDAQLRTLLEQGGVAR
jgi:hypothetical protein